MANIEVFKGHVIDAGVLDPEGVHHELSAGMHGRKLDFDKIATTDPLYEEWTTVSADFIKENYHELPEVVVGVANGTNRTALDTARRFDGKVFGAVSEKDERNSKILRLGEATIKLIAGMKPEFVVVLEDIGTTGSNAVQVAMQSLEAGAQRVEVIATWQRRPQLERLIEAEIAYRAMIYEPLPTYTSDECQAAGFCAQNWELIERKSST